MPDDLQTEIARRLAAEEALRRSEQRLAAQSAALTELTAPVSGSSGRYHSVGPGQLERVDSHTLEGRLRTILETWARTIETPRVSVWRFTDDRGAIRCLDLYDARTRRNESGQVLPRRGFPEYFRALEYERVVAASDARNDPRTRAFLETYLVPNDITRCSTCRSGTRTTCWAWCAPSTSVRRARVANAWQCSGFRVQ